MQQTILVTGGAGYIGSHTVVELIKNDYKVVVLDNLCNSSYEVLERLEMISGESIPFVQGDVRDKAALKGIFEQYPIDAVIHFAGLKAVGESAQRPTEYYDNNITGLLTLLEAMQSGNVRSLIFSSSATVYGNPRAVPIDENSKLQAANPYGRTKLFCEEILRDVLSSNSFTEKSPSLWKFGILRYFNPVGAHETGLIGESPLGTPNNLMPYIAQVASGVLPQLKIYGNDYPTIDGTGVRDYIHVLDLAAGHVSAVKTLLSGSGEFTLNLGTGQGYSVLEVIRAYEKASGRSVPFEFVPRRPGDIAECFADTKKAQETLNWVASRNLDAMCRDSWRWQLMNPNGFTSNSK